MGASDWCTSFVQEKGCLVVKIEHKAKKSKVMRVPQPLTLKQAPSKRCLRILKDSGGNGKSTTGLSTLLVTRNGMGDASFIDLGMLILNLYIGHDPQWGLEP